MKRILPALRKCVVLCEVCFTTALAVSCSRRDGNREIPSEPNVKASEPGRLHVKKIADPAKQWKALEGILKRMSVSNSNEIKRGLLSNNRSNFEYSLQIVLNAASDVELSGLGLYELGGFQSVGPPYWRLICGPDNFDLEAMYFGMLKRNGVGMVSESHAGMVFGYVSATNFVKAQGNTITFLKTNAFAQTNFFFLWDLGKKEGIVGE